MRILFLGSPNNQFIQNLAIELKNSNPNIQLEAISIPNHSDIKTENIFHKIFNINLSFSFIEKVPFIKSIYYYIGIKKILDRNEKYDVISIQMVYYYYFLIINLLKKKSNRLYLTFWGSDFNNLFLPYKYLLKHIVKNADKISCANPKLQVDLEKYFRIDDDRVSIVRFGLRPLDHLSEIRNSITINEAKEKLNLHDNFIITIGTNSSKNQNHFDIIESLAKIKLTLPENYCLVLPMTYGYGNRSDYIDQIKNLLRKENFKFKIFENYLSDHEVALLRLSTDIMIQLQSHDQLSGAMQEHLYAGNIVITGSWLDYNVMKQINIFFFEINQISELEDILPKLFKNIQLDYQKRNENSQKIWDLSSWEKTIQKWVNFYKIKQ